MPNPNSLKQLYHNKSAWNYPKTTVLRVPENIKNEVISYAKKLDSKTLESTVTVDELKALLLRVDNKEIGFKNNSASKLIAELRRLTQGK